MKRVQGTKKLKIGDVVSSKEHNCRVTIETDESNIGCVWFDRKNRLHREALKKDDLTIVPW